jgi:phosphoglucomutase
MHKEGAQLVLASDPDTDRMGVAQNINGDTYYFNGNEIATLMLYYKLTQMKEKNLIKDNPLVIKTIVTSPLQQTICDAFNVELVNTLTGFKWMGGYLNQLDEQKKDYQFVFASEESFGSMTHHKVRDKDGISSVALFCELAIYYDQQGKNLVQVLDDIYTEFGFHQESLLYNVYEGLGGKDKISRIMDYFRREVTQDFCGQKIKIFEDYLEGVKKISGKKETLNFPSSNVLGLHFQNNDQLYLRPSGTEPKIKFYTMVNVTEGNLEEKKKVAAEKIALIEKKIAEICDAI